MARISGTRMSGTAQGTTRLHGGRDAVGGDPLALVRTGDMTAPDLPARRLHRDRPGEGPARRPPEWRPSVPPPQGGYAQIVPGHLRGAALLHGCRGAEVGRDSP